ncbi:BLUF domain-containing protein [Roseivirga pacifica]|uniref:BLUF domain-containing protein n=1 Tax=Roseivirga pacifica TaxID=1267423 RepID=UPI00227A8AB6|nr:BLUF domain-containing protein [Roseivirga pacifica]
MLFQLIYRSKAKPNLTDKDLEDILETARNFNSSQNITGCLLYHKGLFLQLLEGDFNAVNELYNGIRKDTRHSEVITLHMQEAPDRIYNDWSMAFKALKENLAILEKNGAASFKELPSQNNTSPLAQELFNLMSKEVMND